MKQDIEIIRGTSNTFEVEVTDANGEPYTLASGESIIFGVKKRATHMDYVLKKVVTESTDGVCTVILAPEDTASLPFGKYFFDVGLQSGAAFYNIIGCSEFIISENITKWGDGSA